MRLRNLLFPCITIIALLLIAPPAFSNTSSPELFFQKTRNWSTPYKPLDLVQSADGNMVFILTENHQILIYESNGTLKGSIPVDKGVTSIDTDIRGENILLIDSEKSTFTSISFDFIQDINVSGSPFKGNENAPVTIAVFSNFQ